MGGDTKTNKKGGRNPLPEKEKRRNMVRIMLTDEELGRLEEKRKLTNDKQGVFARKCVLKSEWNIRCATDTATLSQLRKIGVNANQIARHLNSGGAMDADIADEIKAMKAEITSLARFIKGAE